MVVDLGLPWASPSLGAFARFAVASLLIELTPGPNMGYLAIVSAQQGRRAGFLVVAGVAAGLAFYLSLSVIGIAEGLLAHRVAYQALRWSGVAYILWLAIEALRAAPVPSGSVAKLSAPNLIGRGVLTNLLNVKAALFYVAILPSFVDPSRGSLASQAAQLGSLHILIATVVHATIVTIASFGRGEPYSSRLRSMYAVGLFIVAGWLAWSTRGG